MAQPVTWRAVLFFFTVAFTSRGSAKLGAHVELENTTAGIWRDSASSLRTVIKDARAQLATLHRRTTEVHAGFQVGKSLPELHTYGNVDLGWPAFFLPSACSQTAGDIEEVAVQMVLDFSKKLSDITGHHARYPSNQRIMDTLFGEIAQLELNVKLEEERWRVLEGMLDIEGRSSCAHPQPSSTSPSCYHEAISAFTRLKEEATADMQGLEAWCHQIGGCPFAPSPSESRLAWLVDIYIKEQLGAGKSLLDSHFIEVYKVWGKLDKVAERLHVLDHRSRCLGGFVVGVFGANLPKAWAGEEMIADGRMCSAAGLAVDGVRAVFRRVRALVDELQASLPSKPSATPLAVPDTCRAAMHLALWVELTDTDSLTMSAWHDMVVHRINVLGVAWSEVSNRSVLLNDWARTLPDYRRRAFEEIYANERWAPRGSSGGGSHQSSTGAIAPAVAALVARLGVRSVLDVGCGWGQWLPPALCDLAHSGRLAPGLNYVGWDVARQPIEALPAKAVSEWSNCGVTWAFEVRDAVDSAIPRGVGLVVLRHVLQHLGHRDTLAVLRNIRQAQPSFLLITQARGRMNADADQVFGTSSSFAFVSGWTQQPLGYDLLKPPFSFPEPLEELAETRDDHPMLLFRGSDLPAEL